MWYRLCCFVTRGLSGHYWTTVDFLLRLALFFSKKGGEYHGQTSADSTIDVKERSFQQLCKILKSIIVLQFTYSSPNLMNSSLYNRHVYRGWIFVITQLQFAHRSDLIGESMTYRPTWPPVATTAFLIHTLTRSRTYTQRHMWKVMLPRQNSVNCTSSMCLKTVRNLIFFLTPTP